MKYLKSGGIPIVAGFQGINSNSRITTIGRGGTDASAIMLARFFNAEKCIIYTDVDGVYTTDPNTIRNAKKIKIISYEEMLEMASLGAKVMQPHSIQDARLNRIDVDVRSSFKKVSGTSPKIVADFYIDDKALEFGDKKSRQRTLKLLEGFLYE